MTVFKSTDGLVVGQPLSPFFGAQCGASTPGPPVMLPPDAALNGGPQPTVLEALSRGTFTMNASVTNVGGTAAGAPSAAATIGQANFSIGTMLSSGTGGATTSRGVAIPGQANNPTTGNVNGALNQQVFVDGIGGGAISTGPTPTDTSALTEAPVSAATVIGAVSGFQG
jgi:hypothetical protein